MAEHPRYLNLQQVVEEYPGVFTERLLRHLVAKVRIPHTYAGRRLIFAVSDLEAYLAANRREVAESHRNLRRSPQSTSSRT